jgi:hypothetical protein
MKTTMSKQLLFLAAFCCMAAPVAAQTVDVTLQCGQSYTINSTVAATAGATYRWLENGSTVTGTAANYTVPTTKSVGVYTYIRQAMSEGCTDWQNSNAFTVEVKNKDGIDGVCLGGVMWAKYNVDEPGSFTTDPMSVGKYYQFNRKVPHTPTDCGDMDQSIPELTWLPENDPCPVGWRVPLDTEMSSLLAHSTYSVDDKALVYRFCASAVVSIMDCPAAQTLMLANCGELSPNCTLYNWHLPYYRTSVGSNALNAYGINQLPLSVNNWCGKAQALPVRCVKL